MRYWFAPLIFLVALAPATAAAETSSTAWGEFRSLLQDLGPLLGPLLGLLGIALAAYLGIGNLMRAQEQKAKLDRDRDEALRDDDRRSLAAALRGELLAIKEETELIIELNKRRLKLFAEGSIDPASRRTMRQVISHPDVETPVFNACVERIGLLPPELAERISRTYSEITSWTKRRQSNPRLPGDPPDPDLVTTVVKTEISLMKSTLDRIDAIVADLDRIAKGQSRPAAARGPTGS